MVAHSIVVAVKRVRNQDLLAVWIWDMKERGIRIFDLLNGRIGLSLTEIGKYCRRSRIWRGWGAD